jgi:hypothetical protein
MEDVTATISVGDEGSLGTVAALLGKFPRGSKVRLAVSKVQETEAPPGLDEYRARVAQARRDFVKAFPWSSPKEALRDLREGERE